MDELINYKLGEFLQKDSDLITEYTRVLKYLEPIPTANDIKNLKLKEVEYIKKNIDNDEALAEIFKYAEGIDEKQLMKMKITTFYGLYNSIVKQLEAILNAESTHLVSIHSNYKWEAVEGSKRLSVLGILPMVDNLAGGDILKYDSILNMNYQTVFKKLMLDTLKGDIQQDMEKLKTK
jgi:hypothetical protein